MVIFILFFKFPPTLSSTLKIGGVSLLIHRTLALLITSGINYYFWQSQIPSLINRTGRDSRLPSSPALIAAIKSPLNH